MWTFNSNMTRGELDPRLAGRTDLELYYNGLKTATNVMAVPQGGMMVRPGFEYLNTAFGDGRIEAFTFDDDNEYLLVFTNLKMEVYKNGAPVKNAAQNITNVTQANPAVVTISSHPYSDGDKVYIDSVVGMTELNGKWYKVANSTTNTFELTDLWGVDIDSTGYTAYSSGGTAQSSVTVTTPYSAAESKEFDYVQSLNTIIITHEDYAPRRILRASDTSWTITDLSSSIITNIPQYDFNDASSPTPTSHVQDITFTNMSVSDRFKLSLKGIITDEIVYGGSANAERRTATEVAIKERLGEHPLLRYDDITVAHSTGSTFTITLANGSADSYDAITGTLTYKNNSATVGQIDATVTTAGTSRSEDAWSSTRGWPRTCTFHEGRLYFGGSKGIPNGVWGSNVFDFFNFREGRGLDDEAIAVYLNTDTQSRINAIYSNRFLQIFTSEQEFAIGQSPITPENVAALPQTSFGALRVRPVSLNGVTIYPQHTGKAVRSFVYDDGVNASTSASLSILSPHLISNPVKLGVSKGSGTQDAQYVYIVNDNGNLTVFNSVASQGIEAFTSWQTDGDVKSVAVVSDTLYLLVARSINGQTVYFVERENFNMRVDAGVRAANIDSVTFDRLDHLEGETVTCRALTNAEVSDGLTGGSHQGDFTVSSGTITLTTEKDTIEAGLEYNPIIKTMPLNIPGLPGGMNVASKKRIQRAALELYESNGVIVNGQRIYDRTIGVNQFEAPQPFTGLKRKHLSGWSLTADVTITQDTPMPFHVLSIGLEVKT